MTEISIILPVYNEAEACRQIVRRIHDTMSGLGREYELIVIDDGSTDGSTEIVRSLENVVAVFNQFRTGSGAARKKGIMLAKGRIGVTLDADGTYNPEDIPLLLSCMKDNDQVNGARSRETGNLKAVRVSVKFMLNRLASFLSGVRIPDLNTGLKAFDISAARKYFWLMPDGFSSVSTLTLAFILNGYRVKWVPVEYMPRLGRSKFNPFTDTYKYAVTILRCCSYFKPLKTFFPLGFLLLAAGAAKSLIDIFCGVPQESKFIDVVLLISGIIVMAIGLLADLLLTVGRHVRDNEG